tara:strand:+ start:1563 stop:1820 length:258 start_codon:yes stop_codon:yes gene_type:complete
MRPLNVSLDDETYALAKKKSNFSAWVRAQLRSEQLQRDAIYADMIQMKCSECETISLWPIDEKYPFCRNTRYCAGRGTMSKVVGE